MSKESKHKTTIQNKMKSTTTKVFGEVFSYETNNEEGFPIQYRDFVLGSADTASKGL